MPDPGLMLKDLDDFRGRSWRPWVFVLLLLLLVGGVLVWRGRHGGAWPWERPPERPVTAAPATALAAHYPAVAVRPGPPPPEVDRRMAAAAADAAADRLVEARTNYLALLERTDIELARPMIESRLGEINLLLVTTPRAMPGKIDYTIRGGDSLKVLARRFGVPAALIQKANNIPRPDLIHVGDRLRILDKPALAVTVRKGACDLVLTLNGAFFKRYIVGTGQYGRTPVGTFRIQDKIENPPWWRPDGREVPFGDPENILGTRWMSIVATGETDPVKGYGIHGTWDDASLGKQSSAGCIRMRNAEVEELYLLLPEGAPVAIVE